MIERLARPAADPRRSPGSALFQDATAQFPGYISVYSYERVAHVRSAFAGSGPGSSPHPGHCRYPDGDESLDWSLLLERRSFAFFFISMWALIFFLLLRIV